MAIQLFTPILVRVQSDSWKAYPMHGDNWSERDMMLLSEITRAGGIDESVPQGFYHFNIIPFNGQDMMTLNPAGIT